MPKHHNDDLDPKNPWDERNYRNSRRRLEKIGATMEIYSIAVICLCLVGGFLAIIGLAVGAHK